MIALDTNILVRYLTQDEPDQARLATEFIEERLTDGKVGFVSLAVLCETIWTLRSRYRRSQAQLRDIVAGLLEVRHLLIEEGQIVEAALGRDSIELTDAIIHEIGRANGCEHTTTFDEAFARLEGVELLGPGSSG